MSTQLILGPVAFNGFEIPAKLNFGGAQRLAIHRLPGGVRVIDAMGRDDADIAWNGIFTGSDAAWRARLLDVMRASGAVLELTWDAFLYSVVIQRFDAEFHAPWWVPYRIVCNVVQDEAQALVGAALSLGASLAGDLLSASAGFDMGAPTAAIAAPGATTSGTAAQASALSTLQNSQAGLENALSNAGSNLNGGLDTLATNTGSLAQLANARGYLGRATANLASAST